MRFIGLVPKLTIGLSTRTWSVTNKIWIWPCYLVAHAVRTPSQAFEMGRKQDLQFSEKGKIVTLLSKGRSSLEISKILKRDHRTIKKFANASGTGRKRRDQAKFRKITDRQLHNLKRHVATIPFTTSRKVFQRCGLPKVSRTTRCKALKEVAVMKAAPRRPMLSKTHKSPGLSEIWKQISPKSCSQTSAGQHWTDPMDGQEGGLLKDRLPQLRWVSSAIHVDHVHATEL